jgi:carbon monoxide dehydrogenase subunit G
MKIEGAYVIPAAREVVWQHLMNPDVLARSIPGCEKLVPNSDGSYHAEMKIAISAVKGTYRGRVEVLDTVAPERYRMKVQGQGTSGFVKGEGTLTLQDDGAAGTKISYAGDAQVGGVIANVGQRLIQAAAQQMVNHFLQQLAEQVQMPQSQQVVNAVGTGNLGVGVPASPSETAQDDRGEGPQPSGKGETQALPHRESGDN